MREIGCPYLDLVDPDRPGRRLLCLRLDGCPGLGGLVRASRLCLVVPVARGRKVTGIRIRGQGGCFRGAARSAG